MIWWQYWSKNLNGWSLSNHRCTPHENYREPHTSYGSRTTSLHHLETSKGLALRNRRSPYKSSSLRCIGVPVMHQRCLAYNRRAISVAAPALVSTIWASSKQILHQNILVSGVGLTGYLQPNDHPILKHLTRQLWIQNQLINASREWYRRKPKVFFTSGQRNSFTIDNYSYMTMF